MPNGSISFNPSRASTSNIPTCAVTGSRNICSIGSRWTTLQNTTQRHNSTNLTGSPRDGLPTISAAPRGRRGSAELVTHELFSLLSENPPLREAIDFYKHKHNWSNRLIAGDSLLVMNSLLA